MTIRAVLLGLLGACFVCGFTYFNDEVMHQTFFVGNNMPIAVYGGLILFLLIVNPLLWRAGARLALPGAELAVILTLTLAACCIPSSGLMRYLTVTQILPHQYNRTEPGWKSQGVVDMAPKRMLADVTPDNEGEVLVGIMKGLPRPVGQDHIWPRDVPWSAWGETLAFWLPLVLTLWIGLIGLSVVVHRQWASHEQLPYPIATFADSLLPGEGSVIGSVFRSRMFWIATIAVVLIHGNNFANAFFPDHTIQFKRTLSFGSLGQLFPTFIQGNHHSLLTDPTIYFTVVAVAYFLATEVSLSLGVGPYIYCYVTGLFVVYGISLGGGGYMHPKPQAFLLFGSYLAAFIGLVILGRHYYGHVFRRAVFIQTGQSVERASVWGARVFGVCMVLVVLIMCSVGLDWQLAVLYTLLTVILFLVMARIMAETGVFFIQPWWFPCVILLGFFGAKAINPKTFLILMMLSLIVLHDPREALMPFIVNSLKLLDLRRTKVGPVAGWCGVALLLGLAVAVPVTLYFQYDLGMNQQDRWAIDSASKFPYQETMQIKQRLTAQDALDEANAISGWSRFAHMKPNGGYMLAFGVGMGLVGLFTLLRVRFTWWPLHPIMFLTWASYPGLTMAFSFVLGWFIKVGVTKYGGASGYQRLKPLMFGLIAGDMVGSVLPMLIGSIMYFITGDPPKGFQTMPG